MEKKLYVVETISYFRHRYVVNARCEIDATDEVVMNVSGSSDNFEEFSQKHIDECVMDAREITADEYLKIFDKDNDYLKDWPIEKKMQFINEINYDKE
jgi:hypothetical protein